MWDIILREVRGVENYEPYNLCTIHDNTYIEDSFLLDAPEDTLISTNKEVAELVNAMNMLAGRTY